MTAEQKVERSTLSLSTSHQLLHAFINMAGESRTELLAWLNDLLQLSITKVEQAGTGSAYCQVIDSIYRDVPLSRCKFNAKSVLFSINFYILNIKLRF